MWRAGNPELTVRLGGSKQAKLTRDHCSVTQKDAPNLGGVFCCVPGMGNNLAVKVRYGGKQRQPLVDGKGVHREV